MASPYSRPETPQNAFSWKVVDSYEKRISVGRFIIHRYAGLEKRRSQAAVLCITRVLGLDIRIQLGTKESHGV